MKFQIFFVIISLIQWQVSIGQSDDDYDEEDGDPNREDFRNEQTGSRFGSGLGFGGDNRG